MRLRARPRRPRNDAPTTRRARPPHLSLSRPARRGATDLRLTPAPPRRSRVAAPAPPPRARQAPHVIDEPDRPPHPAERDEEPENPLDRAQHDQEGRCPRRRARAAGVGSWRAPVGGVSLARSLARRDAALSPRAGSEHAPHELASPAVARGGTPSPPPPPGGKMLAQFVARLSSHAASASPETLAKRRHHPSAAAVPIR